MMLLEIGQPGTAGFEGIRRLKELCSGGLLVMLTVYDDERILEALRSGARVYMLESTLPTCLVAHPQDLANARAAMPADAVRRRMGLFREISPPAQVDYGLTPHEVRLLTLLVNGHNFKTAAAEAGVSTSTVAWHMRRIYYKLQVHSKSEAVAKALRERII